MSDAPNILRDIRMFVTDADGTLLGHRPEFEQYCIFRDTIARLRSRYGAVWVVSTGRGLGSFNKVSFAMRTFGIVPDFVIARHAYIYEKVRIGYKPHWLWNLRVRQLQFMDWLEIRRAIPRLKRAVLSKNPFARVVYRNSHRICFRFDDDGAADYGADIVRRVAQPHKYLQVFHHLREVDVRSVPFTKGLAVAELARHLRVPPERILVIGDGHNDISMMQPEVARYTACPGNAVPEVLETVNRTGGHIAEGRSLAGVMEIAEAFETGRIRSDMPEHWRPSHDVANPLAPRRDAQHERRQAMLGVILVVATLYATLIVLAHFKVIPFGSVILTPYWKLLSIVEKLINLCR